MKSWDGGDWPVDSSEALRAGTDLAGGFFGVLWGLKNDLEHSSGAMGLNNSGSANPCACCRADNRDDSRPWTAFGEDAAWLPTVWTAAAWAAAHPGCCPLFLVAGVTILTLMTDLLHIKHLGVDQYFLASIISMLVYDIMPDSVDENIDNLHILLQQWWKDIHTYTKILNTLLNTLSLKVYRKCTNRVQWFCIFCCGIYYKPHPLRGHVQRTFGESALKLLL